MRFSFIHAADLHIDSPFAGLGIKDPVVAERFARSGRKAVETLIAETIESKAAFLIIAGDVFDGDWKDVTTGLFFARALGPLHRAGIPTFMVKGNHDAESVMSRGLSYPESVHSFASDRAETVRLEPYRLALHGLLEQEIFSEGKSWVEKFRFGLSTYFVLRSVLKIFL